MASMSTKKSVSRHRKYGSISSELVKKSREAAIAAVQIFNNPSMLFKSELFIVLMVIAWTYLLHAYYKKNGIDYRYVAKEGRRNQYKKPKTEHSNIGSSSIVLIIHHLQLIKIKKTTSYS